MVSYFPRIICCKIRVIGTFALAAAIEGWILAKIKLLEKMIIGIGAILLFFPGWHTVGLAFSTIALILLLNLKNSKQNRSTHMDQPRDR